MGKSQGNERTRPTIGDVAQRAGVSKSAVSFALNGRPGVSDATRQRVLAIAAEMGWRPSLGARGLSIGRAFAVGVILARPRETVGNDPFFGLLLAGLETRLAPLGYVLVLSTVTDESERSAYERLISPHRVDGFVLTNLSSDDQRIQLLLDHRVPAVLVGTTLSPGGTMASLHGNDQPGIDAAVAHLVELGHRRIAHVAGPPELLHTSERRDAFRDAMKSRGLRAGGVPSGHFTSQGGAAATRRLLSRPDPPTAIIYANDLMAVGGASAARDFGLRIPEDLSIVGFDDIPLAAHLSPALTTVRQDPTIVGQLAAEALVGLIDGRPTPALIALPEPQLVVRASTARLPSPRPL